MSKEKIFVSAYACEPDKGSELGVGWHWILEMSRQYNLWVLTRESNKSSIEYWMAKNPGYENIQFVYYDLPSYLRWWKKGLRGVRTYYCLWQRLSNKLVKQVMKQEDIKIYHLLTYGNALWPASRYGMKQYFVWGPVGGTDIISVEFSKQYSIKPRLIELTRRVVIKLLPINYGFVKRCKNADIILCKTEFMQENVPIKYRHKTVVFTDVAVEKRKIPDIAQDKKHTVKYLAVGRLDAWRGFDLLIEAFNKAKSTEANIQLEIIGDGIYRKNLQKLIDKYQLSNSIVLLGKLSEEEYIQKMNVADVVVNSALKEGNVTVAFDSIWMGKPLICIDTKGYTKSMGDNAIVVEKNTRVKVIDDLTAAITSTIDKTLRESMGRAAVEIAEQLSWEEKGKAINNLIENNYGR